MPVYKGGRPAFPMPSSTPVVAVPFKPEIKPPVAARPGDDGNIAQSTPGGGPALGQSAPKSIPDPPTGGGSAGTGRPFLTGPGHYRK